MSENLGYKTVLSGSVSKGKNDSSQSLQMIQRPLMTTDELKSMPKGHFILMKTGKNPMKTKLKLFTKWGITLDRPYEMPKRSIKEVEYANMDQIKNTLMKTFKNDAITFSSLNVNKIMKKGGVKVE